MALHGSGEGRVLNISEMPYGRRQLSHVCQHKRCGREGLLPRATDTDKTWRSNWPINNLWLWQSLNLHFWTFLVDWPETFKDLKTAFKNEKTRLWGLAFVLQRLQLSAQSSSCDRSVIEHCYLLSLKADRRHAPMGNMGDLRQKLAATAELRKIRLWLTYRLAETIWKRQSNTVKYPKHRI